MYSLGLCILTQAVELVVVLDLDTEPTLHPVLYPRAMATSCDPGPPGDGDGHDGGPGGPPPPAAGEWRNVGAATAVFTLMQTKL